MLEDFGYLNSLKTHYKPAVMEIFLWSCCNRGEEVIRIAESEEKDPLRHIIDFHQISKGTEWKKEGFSTNGAGIFSKK